MFYNSSIFTKTAIIIIMLLELSEEPSTVTEPNEPISFMVLVTILSVVLASVLIGIILLISIILAIIKCPKRTHKTMEESLQGEESIQTMANVCYGGLLGQQRTHQVDNESNHVYDDITVLKPATDQDYENVDPSTGFPIVPKTHSTRQDHTDGCERACLPLKVTKSVASLQLMFQQQKSTQISRAYTFRHKQCNLQTSHEESGIKGAVSVILRATDYEEPIAREVKTMPR